MMNSCIKAAFSIPQSNCSQLRAALFHSTPILERKRCGSWDSRYSCYSRRSRKLHLKHSLLRNINAYADHILQSWEHGFDEEDEDPFSSKRSSWFKKQDSRGSRRGRSHNQGNRRWGRKSFCEDDVEVETIFRSAFGGNRYFYWSFINEEEPQWRSSSGYSDYYGWRNRRYRFSEDCGSSSESDSSESDLTSERLTLGLSACGPLNLEDVKKAYRACALTWHPDRHQGPSKAIAEEKFKICSAAYQSLCDKLAAA